MDQVQVDVSCNYSITVSSEPDGTRVQTNKRTDAKFGQRFLDNGQRRLESMRALNNLRGCMPCSQIRVRGSNSICILVSK